MSPGPEDRCSSVMVGHYVVFFFQNDANRDASKFDPQGGFFASTPNMQKTNKFFSEEHINELKKFHTGKVLRPIYMPWKNFKKMWDEHKGRIDCSAKSGSIYSAFRGMSAVLHVLKTRSAQSRNYRRMVKVHCVLLDLYDTRRL